MTEEQTKWYDKKKLVLLLYVFLWPVGLYGLWKSNVFSKGWKIGGTLLAAFVLILIFNAGGKKDGVRESTQSSPQESSSSAVKATKAAYVSDPNGRQSISVQQIFEDTTNWSGSRLITGYVKKLEVPKDAMGQGDKVTYLFMGYDDKNLQIVLNNPIPEGVFKINDQITVEADINLLNKSYGVGRGDVYDGPVNVAAWDASMKEKVPSVITVDDYFSKNMKLGSQPITIVGQVATKRVDHNEVWIILGASGGKVHGELSRFKINDTVKQQYESIQIGSRVAFKGSFNMETGNSAYFTIEEIVLNPSY